MIFFEEHGKTLNFVCQIITNENVYLADKQRSSDWTAKLCRFLDLDGVIISQEGFGNPDTDLIMNCRKIEAEGIKTVIITDEYAGRDGKSQSLADADPSADAVITGGNANQLIRLPKMDKTIGTLEYCNQNCRSQRRNRPGRRLSRSGSPGHHRRYQRNRLRLPECKIRRGRLWQR